MQFQRVTQQTQLLLPVNLFDFPPSIVSQVSRKLVSSHSQFSQKVTHITTSTSSRNSKLITTSCNKSICSTICTSSCQNIGRVSGSGLNNRSLQKLTVTCEVSTCHTNSRITSKKNNCTASSPETLMKIYFRNFTEASNRKGEVTSYVSHYDKVTCSFKAKSGKLRNTKHFAALNLNSGSAAGINLYQGFSTQDNPSRSSNTITNKFGDSVLTTVVYKFPNTASVKSNTILSGFKGEAVCQRPQRVITSILSALSLLFM